MASWREQSFRRRADPKDLVTIPFFCRTVSRKLSESFRTQRKIESATGRERLDRFAPACSKKFEGKPARVSSAAPAEAHLPVEEEVFPERRQEKRF